MSQPQVCTRRLESTLEVDSNALRLIMGAMDFDTFKQSLGGEQPPAGASLALQALWWDAKGDWHKAHECAQAQDDKTGAWVHAYLHRKEGDVFNASYWYRRAGQPVFTGTLEEEWDGLARALEQR